MVADAHNVYSYDPVLKSNLRVALKDFVSIQQIAVNLKTKTVFVLDFNPTNIAAPFTVFSTLVSINATNKKDPFLQPA